MNEVYKKIITYVEKIKKDSSNHLFIFGINKDTIIYLALILLSINFIFLIENIKVYHFIIAASALYQAESLKRTGYSKLLQINIITLYLLFLTLVFKSSILLALVVILFSIVPIKDIIKRNKIKKLSNFYLFEEDGIKGCNLIIKEITPIKTYDELVKINIQLEHVITLNEINEFNNNFLLYTDKVKQLFIGFKYIKNNYEVYLYTSKIDLDDLKKYLDKNINYKYDIKKIKDKNYKFYYNKICPSDKLFMHMCNKNILSKRLPVGIDLYQEQFLVLILAFEEKKHAMECMKHLEETKEYEKINYDNNLRYVLENNLNSKYNHILYVKQKTRIGLSKLNMITDKMFDLAESYNGTFEEWGISKEDETTN